MSVNKVILVGNVGRDPEVRYLDRNVAVATFSLATTERGYTTQGGTQVPERTEWHNIVAWRQWAEVAEKYVRKGTQLYVEGKLQTRSWEKDGVKRFTTEIVVETMQMLGRRSDNPAEQQSATPVAQPAQPASPIVPENDTADDLPF